MIYKSSFNSRIGKLYYIWSLESELPEIVFLSTDRKSLEDYQEVLKEKYPELSFENKKSDEIEDSVKKYLSGNKTGLDLTPHFMTGTNFEKRIWKATQKIPYGKVASYREIAEKAGCPGAWRAAGTALNHNPVMLVVPCHRVIKSSGQIGFFGGGEDLKSFLLDLEQS